MGVILTQRAVAFGLVQSVSLFRSVATFAFVVLALQPQFHAAAVGLYVLAALSDFVDGWMARRLEVESDLGQALDLLGDKYLTIASCLYAAVRGVPLVPLGAIILRELLSVSMRSVLHEGAPVLNTNRLFGGLMAASIWGTSLLLLLNPGSTELRSYDDAYAALALVYWIHMLGRLAKARGPLSAVSRSVLSSEAVEGIHDHGEDMRRPGDCNGDDNTTQMRDP